MDKGQRHNTIAQVPLVSIGSPVPFESGRSAFTLTFF